VQSGIAARWAVRLGYENVYRYQAGIMAWEEKYPEMVENP